MNMLDEKHIISVIITEKEKSHHGKIKTGNKFGKKAKIALQAIRGLVTINELATQYKVHPNQIFKWKKQATDNMASLFTNGRSKIKKDDPQKQLNSFIGKSVSFNPGN